MQPCRGCMNFGQNHKWHKKSSSLHPPSTIIIFNTDSHSVQRYVPCGWEIFLCSCLLSTHMSSFNECQPCAFQWCMLHCRMNCIYHIHKIRIKIKIFSVTKQQYFYSCKGRQADIKDDVKEILTVLIRRRLQRTFILVGFLVSTWITAKSGLVTIYVTIF